MCSVLNSFPDLSKSYMPGNTTIQPLTAMRINMDLMYAFDQTKVLAGFESSALVYGIFSRI